MASYIEGMMGDNERVVFITRKHLIVIIRTLLWTSIAAILIVIGAGIAASLTAPTLGGLGGFLGLLAIIPLAQLAVVMVKWLNEQYVVTNRRVVRVEGFINKHVADSSLEKVNDVVMVQTWLGRLLDYGNVDIITGSDVGVNHFEQIARPVAFKREMMNQKEAMGNLESVHAKEERILKSEAPGAGDIPELIAELDELRQKGVLTEAEFAAKKDELLRRI